MSRTTRSPIGRPRPHASGRQRSPAAPSRAAVALIATGATLASAFVLAAVAPAAVIPATGTLVGHRVDQAPATKLGAAPAVHPFLVRDPARYARQKAAADQAYAAYAASHPSISSLALSPNLAIVALNQPGISATDSTGATPPDETGAAGPNHYLEMVNARISVYDRTTLASPPVATATEDAFVNSSGTCDGQIKWDQAAQRYLYYALDCATTPTTNGFSFGWSKTADPTNLATGWCKYHTATGNIFNDYGKLGNSDSFIIIGTDEFLPPATPGGPPVATGPGIFALPKPANGVTTCSATTPTITKFTPPAADATSPEPANVFGSSRFGYVVAASGSSSTALRMYHVSGTTTPVLNDDGNITVPTYAVPPGVPQPGSTDKLDSSDTRLTQAMAAYDPALGRPGIWTQHTIAGTGGSVVRWYELDAETVSVVQMGTIAVPGQFAFNGAISPTRQGNAAAIDYNVGGSSLNVEARAQIHAIGAAAGTMANETTLGASVGVDADHSCPSQDPTATTCRWGDYASASFDPTDSNAVWGTSQLNGAATPGSASWTTQNFRLTLPGDEPPTVVYTPSTYTPTEGQTVSFDARRSSDPDGTIVSYRWVWGDGTTDGAGATPTHVFATQGLYSVKLYATDSDGTIQQTVAIGHGITVGDDLPTASYTPSTYTPAVGQTVSFNGQASDPDGTIVGYRWVWGDGAPDGAGPAATHAFAAPGLYSVKLFVTDSGGRTFGVGHGITVHA